MSLPPSVAASLEATKVDYGLLGNSGLRVSVPSLDVRALVTQNGRVGLLEWTTHCRC